MRRLRCRVALALVACVLLAGACRDSTSSPAFNGPDGGFLTAVAAPHRNYQLYWLGEHFDAGGLVFIGQLAPGFQDFAGADELLTSYEAKVGNVIGADVAVRLMSHSTWAKRRDSVVNPRSPGVTRRDVIVAGHAGQLITIPVDSANVNTEIIVDFGDTVAVALTHNNPAAPSRNPLGDEQTFLAVMQNLRPYPQ